MLRLYTDYFIYNLIVVNVETYNAIAKSQNNLDEYIFLFIISWYKDIIDSISVC